MKALIFIVLVVLFGCEMNTKKPINLRQKEKNELKTAPQQSTAPSAVSPNNEKPASNYRFVTLFDVQIGWGYDIFLNDVLKIHQPHIPVVQGIQGFKSAYDAELVAKKVIEKLDAGIMPPTLSEQELRELGVIN
jgi:hypothetical protein